MTQWTEETNITTTWNEDTYTGMGAPVFDADVAFDHTIAFDEDFADIFWEEESNVTTTWTSA